MSKEAPTTPCSANEEFKKLIVEYANSLKLQAFQVGEHGLSEEEFYSSGLFNAAVERLRGQRAASMNYKREFMKVILEYLQSINAIKSWESAGEGNRFDYEVILHDERVVIIEIKGCLDGNNTNIFERPAHANEFIIWSLCQNTGADPRKNAWSGIHTRLSAEIIDREQVVDGLIIWDWICGKLGRPCPKILTSGSTSRITKVGSFTLPPPCLYYFPSTVPKPRNNPSPSPQQKQNVKFLEILANSFKVLDNEINYVQIEVGYEGNSLFRRTKITRDSEVVVESGFIELKRS